MISSMYVHDPSMIKSLRGLVTRLTWNPTFQQDLLQEARIHLWLIESRQPGQTPSWYLQSCRFHLQHYLSSGRSVDSLKRRDRQVEFDAFEPDDTEAPEVWEAEDLVISEVSARDLVGLLSRHLSNDERAVLDCLTDGLALREIGRKLGISHTMALRHRCKIAEMLIRLEKRSARQRNLRRTPESFDSRKNERWYEGERVMSQYEDEVKSSKSIEKDGVPVFMD